MGKIVFETVQLRAKVKDLEFVNLLRKNVKRKKNYLRNLDRRCVNKLRLVLRIYYIIKNKRWIKRNTQVWTL